MSDRDGMKHEPKPRAPRSGARPRRSGPNRVLPPITRGGESIEGLVVLEETEEEMGGLLWLSLRNVTLWAAVSPEDRAHLFVPGADRERLRAIEAAALPPVLVDPLRVIASLLANAATADALAIAEACDRIGRWAVEGGLPGTAIAFAQAAALAAPDDAARAYAVGRLLRDHAEFARAESWFRVAVSRGRQNGDWSSYALAHVGLGNLYLQRGRYPAARRAHTRAYRVARRHRLRPLMGIAAHDLVVVATAVGKVREAERYAEAALAAYGIGHPRLPHLAHDVAYLWMEHGYFGRALEVFRALRPHIGEFPERLLLAASIARAAGATGAVAEFEAAWREALEMVPTGEPGRGVAPALLNLARGAASLRDRERAQEAAERALSVAVDQGEADVVFAAESVLDSLRNESADVETADPQREVESQDGDRIAEEMIRSLAAPGRA